MWGGNITLTAAKTYKAAEVAIYVTHGYISPAKRRIFCLSKFKNE
jgi:hypothetical protein